MFSLCDGFRLYSFQLLSTPQSQGIIPLWVHPFREILGTRQIDPQNGHFGDICPYTVATMPTSTFCAGSSPYYRYCGDTHQQVCHYDAFRRSASVQWPWFISRHFLVLTHQIVWLFFYVSVIFKVKGRIT